jgi:Domain of unknown function (DUF4157)
MAAPHAAPRSVHTALAGPGRALDAPTRAFFEPRLGADLGAVRVHEDGASVADVSARAYTVGSDIVMRPGTASDRQLLAHELAHVLQQQSRVQRKELPIEASVTVTSAPDRVNLEVTPRRDISGRELRILLFMYGRRVSQQDAVRAIDAGKVECTFAECEAGVRAGQTLQAFIRQQTDASEVQVEGPPRSLPPDVEDALKNGLVWLFLHQGNTSKRIKVSDVPDPREDRAVVGVRNSLLLMTEADRTCFWRWVPKGPITGWWELHYRLQQFLEVRANVCNPLDVSVFGTLAGSEDAFAKLKEAEKQRMLVAVGVQPREQLDAAEAARDQALHAAGFDDVGAFDEAARTFRDSFRPIAVSVLEELLAQSDAIFADAGSRYMKWDGTVTPLGHQLYDQLYREFRGPPLDRIKDEHPVLRGAGIWETLSRAGGETDFFARLGLFALERRRDVHMVRNALGRDADVVFEFEPVLDAALQRLGATGTVYASIVRDPRYKPSKPLWRKIVDIGLLLLSFVPGPIGILARTASGMIDFATSVQDYDQQLFASGLNLQERPSGFGVVASVVAPVAPDIVLKGVGKAYGGAKKLLTGSGKALEEVAETEAKALVQTELKTAEADVARGEQQAARNAEPTAPAAEQPRSVPETAGDPARPAPAAEQPRSVPETAGDPARPAPTVDQPRPVPETAGDPARPAPAATTEPAPVAATPAPATATPAPAAAPSAALSAGEQAIADQEAVLARRQAALTAAQDNVTAANARVSTAARDATVAETEVAALRSRAEDARRLANEAEARLPAGAKGRARSPAVGPRKAAEQTQAELRRAERDLKRARAEFDDAQAALERPSDRLKRAKEELEGSERQLDRMRNPKSVEAPRMTGAETELAPKLRRPNFRDIDGIKYPAPNSAEARVRVFHLEPTATTRAEHAALMQRMAEEGANKQALGHEFEIVMQQDAIEGITREEAAELRRISDVADKRRISDIGTYEFTIEERISEDKFDQLFRDLQAFDTGASKAANRIILVVPKLHPDDAIKLAKMAAFYERVTGNRPLVLVRETLP